MRAAGCCCLRPLLLFLSLARSRCSSLPRLDGTDSARRSPRAHRTSWYWKGRLLATKGGKLEPENKDNALRDRQFDG